MSEGRLVVAAEDRLVAVVVVVETVALVLILAADAVLDVAVDLAVEAVDVDVMIAEEVKWLDERGSLQPYSAYCTLQILHMIGSLPCRC
jgi:hypothetical protein